jgi:hypothetical protein
MPAGKGRRKQEHIPAAVLNKVDLGESPTVDRNAPPTR